MIDARECRLLTLTVRQKEAKKDYRELCEKIKDAASKGELDYAYVTNEENKYPTITAEQVAELRELGFKVELWNGRAGWDYLKRFYKGALKVSWR